MLTYMNAVRFSAVTNDQNSIYLNYRNPSPSLPWEIISVPVVRPAYGTTGLLLMCPMEHQLKLIIYQGGILYEKVENYLLKSQDNFKNLFK